MRIRLRIALIIAALAVASSITVPLVTASASSPTGVTRAQIVAHHHAARVHAARVHHARLVHAAKLRRLAAQRLLVAKWTHVATCEEGGWIGWVSDLYPDSIGLQAGAPGEHGWYGSGGGKDESPLAQARVGATEIAWMASEGQVVQGVRVYVGWVPDQGACSSW